jgi:hypothetical protein
MMASSSAVDDMLRGLIEDAIFVGRGQEAEDWLQKLNMQFRGVQGRMFLDFSLNRRNVIAVTPAAGAIASSAARCSSACAQCNAAAKWRLLMPQWLQVARASL